MVIDHPALSARYFFPRADEAPAEHRWVVDGLRCARRAQGSAVTLLHFHGNGEVVADWVTSDFARDLEGAGFELVFAEYRGYGGSRGRPTLSALLADALAIFDALGRRPADVVVYGRSIGSLAAAHVAAERATLRALVLESGISDLLERLALRATQEGLRAAVHEAFDQPAKIARAACPTLVLHAEHDHLVGKHHAEQNARAAGDRAELVIYPHGDHNTIHAFHGADIARAVARFAKA
jgi:pimeloyl-ACP methyl ester carboxylesterase